MEDYRLLWGDLQGKGKQRLFLLEETLGGRGGVQNRRQDERNGAVKLNQLCFSFLME